MLACLCAAGGVVRYQRKRSYSCRLSFFNLLTVRAGRQRVVHAGAATVAGDLSQQRLQGACWAEALSSVRQWHWWCAVCCRSCVTVTAFCCRSLGLIQCDGTPHTSNHMPTHLPVVLLQGCFGKDVMLQGEGGSIPFMVHESCHNTPRPPRCAALHCACKGAIYARCPLCSVCCARAAAHPLMDTNHMHRECWAASSRRRNS